MHAASAFSCSRRCRLSSDTSRRRKSSSCFRAAATSLLSGRSAIGWLSTSSARRLADALPASEASCSSKSGAQLIEHGRRSRVRWRFAFLLAGVRQVPLQERGRPRCLGSLRVGAEAERFPNQVQDWTAALPLPRRTPGPGVNLLPARLAGRPRLVRPMAAVEGQSCQPRPPHPGKGPRATTHVEQSPECACSKQRRGGGFRQPGASRRPTPMATPGGVEWPFVPGN